MRFLPHIFISALLLIGLSSCMEVIDIDANFTTPELVVDAWLDQRDTTQTIRLSWSQDFFANELPQGIGEATVTVRNETAGAQFDFLPDGQGAYRWSPATGETLGVPGDVFRLEVQLNEQVYEAITTMPAVPAVDSIVYEYRERVPEIGQAEGYYAEFYATDLPGIGNAYWIKTFKNGQFLSKPAEMNLSYDGTMSAGSGTDGIVFIPSVREAINRLPDPDTDDNDDVPPYAPGDHIRVEIHALGPAAYRFLTIAQEQMTNGDNSIFARPVTNTPGNITAVTAATPAALGCFNVASVSAAETWVQQ